MATLTIHNIPHDLFQALQKRAQGNARSVEEEVKQILQKDVLPKTDYAWVMH